MEKIKIQLKSIYGNILFEYEKKDNTIKDTLIQAIRSNADLSNADLRYADLKKFKHLIWIIPEEGSFIAWKKLENNCIAKLEIPAKSPRTCNFINRKCRAKFVKTLKIWDDNKNEINEAYNGTHDKKILYKVGRLIKADKWDNNLAIDCSHGIHFFITKKEAEEWQ